MIDEDEDVRASKTKGRVVWGVCDFKMIKTNE